MITCLPDTLVFIMLHLSFYLQEFLLCKMIPAANILNELKRIPASFIYLFLAGACVFS